VPSDTTAGRRQQETRTFGATRAELDSLGDWLACWGVSRVGMEATGDYWKPVFFLLESRGFDCQLYNASQVKALPGRPKTDRADSVWLARITERGTVASSFVPPSRSAACAPTPATAGTSPRPAPPRNKEWRNCSRTGT
jgi:transposase